MTIVTSKNVVDLLMTDNIIKLSFIYSYRSKKYWRVLEPICIVLSSGQSITIPEGFTTDLSSVPKWLWSIERPFGDFLLAAIIHDYLYHLKWLSRKKTDKEMLFWSKIINRSTLINRIDNYIRYFFVRAFGWFVWNY